VTSLPAFTIGAGRTVTVRVAVDGGHHVVEFGIVYVMVAETAAPPDTTHVFGLMVAIAVLLEDQVPPVLVVEKLTVAPAQTVCVPASGAI
jgi:hypothetical protein